MAATESSNFVRELKQVDQSTIKCIKFREGCLYYGQVEYPEQPKQAAEDASKEPVKAEKGKPDKGAKDLGQPAVHDSNAKKVRHGLGVQIQYRTDGSVISKYEGSWYKDKRQGFGIAYYSDKSSYHGTFKNDLREGNGTYRWPNGYSYEGEWKDDKMEGRGAFINPKGGSTSSHFQSNLMMVRKGIYMNPLMGEKDQEEFMEKREKIIQSALKASTPSEKSLIFEVIYDYGRIGSVLEFTKSKGRVPFFMSSKK